MINMSNRNGFFLPWPYYLFIENGTNIFISKPLSLKRSIATKFPKTPVGKKWNLLNLSAIYLLG